MKKLFKYVLYTALGLGLIFAILLLILHLADYPVNGVTAGMRSTIESIELGKNKTVKDAIVDLAGPDGSVVWEREENDYFVSVIHGSSADIIKFSYNPSTHYVFLTGFHGSDGNKCEGSQANKCLHKAFKTF